ncbi:Transcription factor Dp-2 [Mortierella alpina]|uniref:Transcription factor Dp-2 n=1 Tax=Mortierella alpina TaxID=64518 RepID=A0A9P6M655_MORAP|nr:Transcription factor Dp-2 [Mortierella alpina]
MTASPRSAPSSSSVAASSSSSMLPSARSVTAASLSNPKGHGHAHAHLPRAPETASPLPLTHSLAHSQHQLYSPPNSVSSISTYSPSSTGESPSGHPLRNQQSQHSRTPHFHRQTAAYADPAYPLDSFTSSAPADSSPRSFARSTYDQDKYPRQQLSPSSFTQPSTRRQHYQLHQSYPTSASLSCPSVGYNEYRKECERTPPPLPGLHEGTNADISSNLPEYSYPMTPSQRPRRLPPRPIHYHHHDQPHHYRQYGPQHEQEQDFYDQSVQRPRDHHSLQQEQASSQQQHTKIPPPIRTKWSDDRVARECPPLTFQSGSNASLGFRSTDWMSPATPRSTQMQGSLLHQSSADQYPMVESPTDFREPRGFQHSINNMPWKTYGREDHGMEHCSEQEDICVREFEDDEEDEDEAYMASQGKRQRLSASDVALRSFGSQLSLTSPTFKITPGHAEMSGKEKAIRYTVEGEGDDDQGPSTAVSSSSSRKPSVSSSLQGDERPAVKGKRIKVTAAKRASRNPPLRLGDAMDLLDDEAQTGTEIQFLKGKGLRIYAQRVCERVQAKGSTSYNELVHELVGGKAGELVEDAPEVPGQENIRRRVYDALNVLEALDIISFDNKDIRWVGIEESRVVQEVSRRSTVQIGTQGRPSHHEGDDESEEPEDDDMEIEKLQKEVDAMKLRNELVQAQLQDQVTRHVQVLNLVKKNKRREAKEHERDERRRQRKEDKRAQARLADQDPSMTDVVPQSSSDLNEEPRRRSERHPRRRSPCQGSERSETAGRDAGRLGMEGKFEEEEEEDEESRQRRKQERRERRERKEKRAQRRLEKEKEHSKIQLPFVVVRMPGYASQSSDSEASISVVRRVRDEQKSRRGSKGRRDGASSGEGTTMVEIKIPQQEDVSIISDTEILGDLGYNTVELDELQAMLPQDLMNNVQYAVSIEETQDRSNPSSQREHQSSLGASVAAVGDATMDLDSSSPLTSVTVRGGFEREIVRAASEGISSTA